MGKWDSFDVEEGQGVEGGWTYYDITSQPCKSAPSQASEQLPSQKHHSSSHLVLSSGLVNPTERYRPQQLTATARLTYGWSGV